MIHMTGDELSREEIDVIVNSIHQKIANDQAELLRELQEARKDLGEAQETISTFNELRELLPMIRQMGVQFDPQMLQKNINSCVRGECRRLTMNVNDIRTKLQQAQAPPQVPLVHQAPPQAPPTPQVFHCGNCGTILPHGTQRCVCGAYFDWSLSNPLGES